MEESESQRWKRNFNELLQELRVVQTGNQILFAFLLTVPFSAGFDRMNDVQEGVYVATLTVATLATVLIIAPVSHHRFLFRQGAKPLVVRAASMLAIGGLALVLLAMTGALFLAVDMVSGQELAALLTAIVVGLTVALWYVIPLALRLRRR